jgi:pyruvate formate-lyase activating enzyme-like uncharacterized protein
MSVGVEIPIAPGLEEWAKKIILAADKFNADFVNLNEMEFVEPNARNLLMRGYRESRTRPFTVEGALQSALKVLRWAADNVKIPVHFCPASFKDSIQTRNRLLRIARLDARWCEIPTRGGLLYWLEDPESGECINPWTANVRDRKIKLVEAYPTRNRLPRVREEIL